MPEVETPPDIVRDLPGAATDWRRAHSLLALCTIIIVLVLIVLIPGSPCDLYKLVDHHLLPQVVHDYTVLGVHSDLLYNSEHITVS